MDSERERVQVRVCGRVQGVFYRASAQQEARSLELVGWVKNLPDGSVTLEAEGRPESIEELLSWVREGPRDAVVDAVEVAWLSPSRQEKDFAIQREE